MPWQTTGEKRRKERTSSTTPWKLPKPSVTLVVRTARVALKSAAGGSFY